MTFRVEVTRDETVASGGVRVEITAYIDRVPDTPEVGHETLLRAPKGVWNSRLLFSGDFAELGGALAAVEARYPEIGEIACNEYSIDSEYAVDMPPLRKSDAGQWRPGKRRWPGPPPLLDWRIG